MHDTILEMLDQVERDHGVSIIFAAESGSRAWGFPSADSDFDVRFVYAHPRDWYLSILEGRDVIELPLDAVLDIKGWDVRKALRLVRKSNTSIRSLLCCRWVIERDSQPPILFDELLEHCLDEPDVAAEIRAMIEVKASGLESDVVPSKPAVNRFITDQFAQLSAELPEERELPDIKIFHHAFRQILALV